MCRLFLFNYLLLFFSENYQEMESEFDETMLAKIDQYLKGELGEVEYLSFEKQLETDEELQEEVMLQQQLTAVLGEDTWISIATKERNEDLQKLSKKLKGEEFQSLSNTIRELGKQYTKEQETTTSTKRVYLYYASAVAVIAFIFIFVMNYQKPFDTYYTDYVSWNELPTYTEKGSNTSNFSKGATAFKNGNYAEALLLFKTIQKEDELYPPSLIYIGASHELMGENNQAINSFDTLTQLQSFEGNSKGYWYKLLVYLKTNDKEKVRKTLKTIISNEDYYHYQEALKLTQELNIDK